MVRKRDEEAVEAVVHEIENEENRLVEEAYERQKQLKQFTRDWDDTSAARQGLNKAMQAISLGEF